MPILVPPDVYEKAVANSSTSPQVNKRKRSRPSTSGIMDSDQENTEASLNDVTVTNTNPPPPESRPVVIFSGFVNPIAEQRVSHFLRACSLSSLRLLEIMKLNILFRL